MELLKATLFLAVCLDHRQQLDNIFQAKDLKEEEYDRSNDNKNNKSGNWDCNLNRLCEFILTRMNNMDHNNNDNNIDNNNSAQQQAIIRVYECVLSVYLPLRHSTEGDCSADSSAISLGRDGLQKIDCCRSELPKNLFEKNRKSSRHKVISTCIRKVLF